MRAFRILLVLGAGVGFIPRGIGGRVLDRREEGIGVVVVVMLAAGGLRWPR
jgi:hypothetical protein